MIIFVDTKNLFMKHITLYLLLVLIAMGLAGCGFNGGTKADIDAAEAAVNEGNYEIARSICETFVTDSTTALDVTDLCRLSIVYMKLSDLKDVDLNTAHATQCYNQAMVINPDSAQAFYNLLPVDEERHVQILSQLYRIYNVESLDEYTIEDDTDEIEPEEVEVLE